jgi:hypothetical protein
VQCDYLASGRDRRDRIDRYIDAEALQGIDNRVTFAVGAGPSNAGRRGSQLLIPLCYE